MLERRDVPVGPFDSKSSSLQCRLVGVPDGLVWVQVSAFVNGLIESGPDSSLLIGYPRLVITLRRLIIS